METSTLLPTTLVGSYPQPDWLIDRERLGERLPPRVPAPEIWRVPEPWLEQAQDDATLLALRDFELAGIDIVTDGEIRRESYSNRFASMLGGLDLADPGVFVERVGIENLAPRVVGPVRREGPVQVRDVEFLRRHTDRPVKITVPGPFTMGQQTQDEHYGDERGLALDLAAAVNAEIRDLFAAGADVVQIDEPYLQARPEKAREYGVEVVDRAVESIEGTIALHMCFGYAHFKLGRPVGYSFLEELNASSVDQISIEAAEPRLDPSILKQVREKTVILGVLDLGDPDVESPAVVAGRIRSALEFVPPERLVLAPDCGMKYLPRAVAFGKLQALVAGTRMVRAELGDSSGS
ncbi:MAG: 5-methyltetrahydropteroyltriglutamate--homocysteine methyltransferase [Gaiellaceae bacterium]